MLKFFLRRPGFLLCLALILVVALGLGGRNWLNYLKEGHYYRAAEKARRERDFTAARSLARLCVDAWPASSRAHFLLTRIARQAGLYESAEDNLAVCERLEGPTDRVRLERTLILVQQGGLTPETERQLRSHLHENHPDAAQILEAVSRGCMSTYRPTGALAYLNEWLNLQPDNAQAYLWRAAMHERLMNFEEAKRDCRQAVASAPQNKEAQVRLAQALLNGGEPKEAAERFEELYRQQPKNPAIAIGLAQAQLKLGCAEPAARLLDELARNYPEDAPVLLERGRLELQRGQPLAAVPWLRKAATLAPGDYQTTYSLLLALQQAGDPAALRLVQEQFDRLNADIQRLDELHEQLKQHPYELGLRCEVARIYQNQGFKEEAVRWLKMVVRMDPDHRLANRLLADYYDESGQPGLAAPYRQRANKPGEPGSVLGSP